MAREQILRRLAELGAGFGWPRHQAGETPRPFNLRLWFALAGAGVILAMGVAFALLMQDFVSDRMLRREAEVTREFLESIIRAEDSATLFERGGVERNPQLASFAHHIRTMPDVLRANIYARDRSILWSTDTAIIGRRFDGNRELEAAFGGQLETEIGRIDSDAKQEHEALQAGAGGLFIEAYIPIRAGTQVAGVVELYKVPNALDAMLRDGQRIIWASTAVGALLLFATLYGIVGRGARLIEGQQTALARMETLAAVGQMAGAIAHSLRNPMAGIRSSAELLRLEQPGVSTLPDDIIAQIDRMDGHVRELLDYARADTPRTQPLDVAMVVGEVLERLAGPLARAGVAVVREDRREAAGRLPLDPRLLAQAIETVVTNAAEAMPTGGRLVVRLEGGRDGTRLAFADTGPGIPAAVLPRVSEPFFTTKTRGLGLGLSIARRIVERFGGRLEIASTEGAGTTVRMHLP